MTINEAKAEIYAYPNRPLSVTFIKRTTGQPRTIVCNGCPDVAADPGNLKFNPEELGLISVFDHQKQAHRFISVEGIQSITIGGETFPVVSDL